MWQRLLVTSGSFRAGGAWKGITHTHMRNVIGGELIMKEVSAGGECRIDTLSFIHFLQNMHFL